MPIDKGTYVPRSEQEILDSLEAELRNEFGADIDLTESSVFSSLAGALATTLASEQEQSLSDVYDSAFLPTAEGEDLDNVVEIIGLSRMAATHATGVVRFTRNSPATQDYPIGKGTRVQTGGDEPVSFETQAATEITHVDGFEGGTLAGAWAGATADYSVQSTTVLRDSYSLTCSTKGSEIHRTDVTVERGDTYHVETQLDPDAVSILRFGEKDSSNTYQVRLDATNSDLILERVDGGSVTPLDTTSVTIPTGERLAIDVDWRLTNELVVDVTGATSGSIAQVSEVDDTYDSGGVGIKCGAAVPTYWDRLTTSATAADIRAVAGGVEGNVGANSITDMPSPPNGVDGVYNPHPTGDTDYTDLAGNQYVVGEAEESDSDLRARAKETVTGGGSATVDALLSVLINNEDLPNITSVSLYNNRTINDNTGSGGLPAKSVELVVAGEDDQSVADAVYSKLGATDRTYGGAHGTTASATVKAVNGQAETIEFSRPTTLDVDLTIDVVVEDNYIGDNALRDRIVAYVGGTNTDGNSVFGTDVAEDVSIDRLREVIMDDEDPTGVAGISSLTTTPSTTTDANGLTVIDVGENEQAETNATDGSIALNTTTL